MERFFWIDIHYACFGMESSGGIVTDSAPIAAWMRGKTLQEIKPFLVKRQAKVIEIKKPRVIATARLRVNQTDYVIPV